MDGRNEENLMGLFEEFLDLKQAEQAVEDLREGERILHEHPAPEPDGRLIADIKAEIGGALLRRKANVFRRIVYKASVVAAAVIILAVIGVELFEKGGGKSERVTTASIIPEAIWESDDILAGDTELAILTAEIEQIEGEALAVQLAENATNGNRNLLELEMELIEINSDFWKG